MFHNHNVASFKYSLRTYQMQITRSWREQRVMLKSRFSVLSDADFEFEDGQKESMMEKLSVKLKKTRSELELLFAELQTY
ncbi:hypothetical protein EV198_0928 [Roseivirga ehrenbergii]|nr:hypothetical protein EV198_0928 [Roseivirga ehrenbergii]